MRSKTKPKIGIIGSGRLGTAVARQLLHAGYRVMISNSKGPESLELILSVLLPDARAATVEETINESDIIVLGIPLHQYKSLKPELFKNKTVIDAMNYWSPTEGTIAEFTDPNSTSSEFMQSYLPQAKVVKTLNHVAYNELASHSLREGDPKRRAIVLAGDDAKAKEQVKQLINAMGFDPVDIGDLKEGRKFQPDTKLFNARYTENEMQEML